MTRQELDAALARLGLNVPEAERDGIAAAADHLARITALMRKPRPVGAEPAHVVRFPER
jgi:hypothetical protein